MPDTTGNIFLTWENLAFSLPLLLICGVYACFKYVPWYIGLPILGVLFVVYQIRQQMIAQRNKKLENLDEKAIQDLIGAELEDDEKKKKNGSAAADKKKQAAINKVQTRLAQERKAEAKKAAKNENSKSNNSKKNNTTAAAAASASAATDDDEEDDDDVDLTAFTKVEKKKTK